MSSAPPATTVRLTIDGREVVVPKGTTVYTAAKQAGIEIPTFCYHDRMAPLGACRVCLVEVEKMPKLATSCTQEAGDGMVVHTVSEKAQAGQRSILELLLINHPLDCPICDKGGECPLQDNTLKFGPGQSRFVEVKRTYRKHLRMGPTLVLDRERCILCWRCVRFGEIVAGDDALQGFERGYHSQIATPQMAPVHSKFIGNTIEICPVGALTSATYRFRSRPWDNRAVKSICPHCGCGCATTLNVRGNDLDRTRSREHPEVNDVWLCDKGFFGYEFVQSPERLTAPLVRKDGALREATWEEALDRIAGALRETPADAVGVIGGARSTNEDNYLLLRLFRGVVGTNSIDFRTDTANPLPVSSAPWGLPGSIADVERADAIVLVGCDLTEEYPIVWLRVKKAVDRGARLVILNPWELEVARWATHSLTHRWGAEAALLEALAGRRDAVEVAAKSGAPADRLRGAAEALAKASRPLVLLGRTAVERPDGAQVLAAAEAIRDAFPAAQIGLLRGRANSGGAQLLGLVPDMLPGYRPIGDADARAAVEAVWGRPVSEAAGLTTRGMLEAARSGALKLLYVVGADPATDYPDAHAWEEARRGLGLLVVHDLFLTRTASSADVVLPVLAYAEKAGTVGNIEGRVQRQDAAVRGPGTARSDGQIFSAIAERLGTELAFASWEAVFAEVAALIPGWAEDARMAPPRPAPVAAPAGAHDDTAPGPAADGALALVVGTRLFDRGTMALRCPGIRGQAGEPFVGLHPDDAARLGIVEGTLCEVRSPRAALRLAVRALPGLHPGHAYVPRGYESAPASVLQDERGPVAVTVRPAGGGA
ncbi:MAG TPA: NADH-quinone oxidoreductase subunit NuoG [bacterium]|nr:NADH-quinone oxidoreductase subunit NuoG [bacterium]